LAYEAAVQGSVLLKNQKATLPLAHGKRVALIGPLRNAKWELLGNYAAHTKPIHWDDEPNVISPEEALRNCSMVGKLILPDGGPETCSITDELVPGTGDFMKKPDADVVVIVAGTMPEDPLNQNVDERPTKSPACQAGCLESEGCDRPNIHLPLGQQKLIRRAAEWGLPVVLVLVSGGPVDLEEFAENDNVSSILWMGYPGMAAGTALASLLFGVESPSGRLTQTFYKSSYLEHISIRDMNTRPDNATGYPGRFYKFVDDRWIRYPFGHGLSYQNWTHAFVDNKTGVEEGSATQEHSGSSWRGCTLSISARMTQNSGQAAPADTLLLFLQPPAGAAATAPRRVLRNFERVDNATAQVDFQLGSNDFELAGEDGKFSLVKGEWTAQINELRRKISVDAAGCRVGLIVN